MAGGGTLVELRQFGVSVGSTQLLEGVNARVIRGQRVAIVGPNGCGKSTLLQCVAGVNDYYTVTAEGVSLNVHSDAVLLVEQDNLQWSRLLGGVLDEEMVRELPLADALDVALGEGFDDATDDMDAWRATCVAAQGPPLSWETARYATTPVGDLSPGAAVRAYLAVAIARRGIELLLLDEPTNHLDLPSVVWLQQRLLASHKAVVFVSHDAVFLDAVADHLWIVDPLEATLTVSGASYTDYRQAEALAREQQQAAFEAQKKRNAKLTAAAEKLRASSMAGEAHVAKDNDKMQRDFRRDRAGRSGKKAKALEKLRDSADTVERVAVRRPLKIEIDPLGASHGDSSIIVGSLVLGYDEPLPVPPVSLRIDFGERVAIVGFNGVGKSTLLRFITKALEPILGGTVSIGRELRLGNLTQEHESLPRDTTPREFFADFTKCDAGAMLIRYGLNRFQVDALMEELNPGARARALLAGFAMRRVNCLILDEPTNHLDEEAVEEVRATVNEFDGTVVVVTHSREFLSEFRFSRLLHLTPLNGLVELGSVEEFVGDLEEAVAKALR